ncbi:hypothetical protein CVD19_21335 [Bacillus sp. T33-2]|nr:hypothetical protein CVD19_21335 [Bacillus sp. T33-2]
MTSFDLAKILGGVALILMIINLVRLSRNKMKKSDKYTQLTLIFIIITVNIIIWSIAAVNS